jgi:hypothetical protein
MPPGCDRGIRNTSTVNAGSWDDKYNLGPGGRAELYLIAHLCKITLTSNRRRHVDLIRDTIGYGKTGLRAIENRFRSSPRSYCCDDEEKTGSLRARQEDHFQREKGDAAAALDGVSPQKRGRKSSLSG